VRIGLLASMKPKPPKVSLRGALGAAWLADPAVTLQRKEQEVAQQLTRLKAESARLWLEVDEPARARALEKSQVIQDEATAKRFLRYKAEAKSDVPVGRSRRLEASVERDVERAEEGWLERIDASEASPAPVRAPAFEAAGEVACVEDEDGTVGSVPAGRENEPAAPERDYSDAKASKTKTYDQVSGEGTLGSGGAGFPKRTQCTGSDRAGGIDRADGAATPVLHPAGRPRVGSRRRPQGVGFPVRGGRLPRPEAPRTRWEMVVRRGPR